MPEHTIPESLVDQIQAGRAVLVVGAGIGVPSWKNVLERMNEALQSRGQEGDEAASKDVAKLLHKGSLTRAAGFLARALSEDTCDEIVKDEWATPDDLPAIVKRLAKLPFRQVWTTFPGDLLESAMKAELPEHWPAPTVITYEDAAHINPRRRTLLKILGDYSSYVVTPKSVRKALSRASDLRDHAHDFYADGALVFVGFRFGDPDLAALLDRVFGAFEPPQSAHYLIAAGVGPVTVDELMSEHHIEVINLPGKGADDVATAAIHEYLDELAAACEAAEVTLAQTRPDDDDLDGWLALLTDTDMADEASAALEAMEEAASDVGDSDRLIDILMGRVEVEEDAANRAGLLRQLAGVFETQVGDLPRAFTALTAALREDPADTTAVDEAERLAEDTDGWAELVADVSAVAGEIEDDTVAAGYWTRLGRWYHQRLHHNDYAVASFRQAMKLDPRFTQAHTGLAEVYRKQQRWAELADVLTAHVELETDLERQVDLYLALGDLYETQLASTSRAIDAYQSAVDLDDTNDDSLAALERLYRRDERWGKLARVLEQRADQFEESGDGTRASALRRELATLRADKLGDLEGAIGKYEAALDADDSDIAALRALEELYEKVGRTDDYLRTLDRLSNVAPEGDRVAILRRLAAELEDRESGLDKAIDSYERLLQIDPAAEDAYRALERILRVEAKWYELVEVYERHIASVKAPAPRVELYLQMADVYERELEDPHRAIEGYLNALSVNDDHAESLNSLARLYTRTEAWDRAVEILVRHAELDGNRGAPLWAEAGALTAEHLEESEQAERFLEKSLSLDPTHLPAMLSLASLHKSRSSWANAVKYLAMAEEHSSNRLERVQLLSEAADICEEQLERPERGLEMLMRVLKLDPEHVEAGLRVSERLVAAERWNEALPVLEMLARKSEDDRLEKARREANLGRAYEALGQLEKAAKHYRLSVDADSDSLEAALGLASMLFARAKTADDVEQWEEVDKRYREILARHRSGLADGQVVEIWHHLGITARARGDEKKADNAFRRALERDPHHPESLAALIQVATARKDWKTVVEAKRDQLPNADDDHKVTLFEEIGDVYHAELEDPVSALGAYLEAIKMRPDSHILLHKTLEIHSQQKQWRRAIETLGTLAEQEKSADRRAKYYYTAAVIARDELQDADVAVEHFNLALDDVPTTPKAFDAVDKLLSDKGDYKSLARSYRKMLKRVGDEAPTEQLLKLWTRLGEICLEHLSDNEAAIAALEVASSLDPDAIERHEQLANLYLEAGESRREDAIEELQVLIQAAPDRVELYRALSNLYMEEREIDKAYCLSQALVFLNAATDPEKQLFTAYRPQQFVLAKRRLTEELWQKAIIHQREDRHLNAIFSSLIGSIAATTAQPASAFNLKAGERTDVDRDVHLVSKVFKYATNILGLDPEPGLYLQPGVSEGIRVANTSDKGKLAPSVLVGNPHVGKKDERELAFEVGKRLAYFRPERYVNYALQTLPKLESAFSAALSASNARSAPEVSGDTAKLSSHIKNTVPTTILDQVGTVANKLGKRVENGFIAGWRTATDLTANRVGLILCNDLETAARLVATESSGMSTMSAKDRLRDLLAYSVSEEYFAVRRHLGLVVREETM